MACLVDRWRCPMPESALRVQKQFWKPLDRAVRRASRPRTVELWQPPFRRPFRLRAEQRGTGLEGLRNPLSAIGSPFGGRRWSPTKLFQNGEVGLWFDPSDFSTMFQDSAGTTPVTAVEQPVGKMLDKSGRGNHRTQSTSAARPTLSARYNLLTKTEDISHSDWNKNKVSITTDATVSPDGNLSADKLVDTVDNAIHQIFQQVGTATTHTFSVCAKAAELSAIVLRFYGAPNNWECAVFDLSNGTNSQNASGSSTAFTNVTRSITSIGNGWYRCSLTATFASGTRPCAVHLSNAASGLSFNFNGENLYTGNGTSGVYLWGADCRPTNDGVGLPAYQRVNTSTDYDTSGFPMYLKYDGTDDFMETAAVDFSGTNKMSVFSGNRRLSDAATGLMFELSADVNSNAGAFAFANPFGASSLALFVIRGDTGLSSVQFTDSAAPSTAVLSAFADMSLSTDEVTSIRKNGAAQSITRPDNVNNSANFGNYKLYFGSRAGTSRFFNGREYQTIIRGAASTAAEIANAEAYVNSKTKAY